MLLPWGTLRGAGMDDWAEGLGERTRRHYERWPYPSYSLLGSVRRRDTWFLNLEALWARFNGERIAPGRMRTQIAGHRSLRCSASHGA